MRVWNRAGVFAGTLVLLVYLTACGKTDNIQPENDAAEEKIAAQTEESSVELPKRGLPGFREMGAVMKEQAQQNYTYRGDTVLTEDNIKETMKSFLQIEDSASFDRLESLPLTEKFFNECIGHPENFPYIYVDDLRQMREFKLNFWGIREDGKCVCLCEFCLSFSVLNAESRCYYVVMDLEDEQIDSMEVTLVKPDSPHF